MIVKMFNIYKCNKFENMYNLINETYLITIFIILFIIYKWNVST